MPSQLETCALCNKHADLLNSHIIPKFVFRWLRETSANDYIRNTKSPNKRVQDGLKPKMLCRDCESLFNKFETEFANNFFHKFTTDDSLSLPYGDWMLKFCASISWRVLKHAEKSGHLNAISPHLLPNLQLALGKWSDFVQGYAPHPERFEQHILPLGPISSNSIDSFPSNINRYFLRAVQIDLAISQRSVLTFAKLGPIAIFGFAVPPLQKWEGTKINRSNGRIQPREYSLPYYVMSYLQDQARMVDASFKSISPSQKEKIHTSARDNIDRLRGSKQLEAIMHDYEMFGRDAVIDK